MEQVTKERENLYFIKMRNITCDNKGCKLFDTNKYPIFQIQVTCQFGEEML